jgi:hypothetical protein
MRPEAADTGKKTIQSPHEPQARYAEKRSTKWVGYRAHVTETANPGEVNFLTDIETDAANESTMWTKGMSVVRTLPIARSEGWT